MDDLTGMRFGKWVVLERDGSDIHRRALWKCQCDCGTIRSVTGKALRLGESKSCGCTLKEKWSHMIYANLIGTRFGRLVVLERLEDYVAPNGRHDSRWRCICDCGNYVVRTYGSLKRGSDKCLCKHCQDEELVRRSRTHGGRNTRLYEVWCSMIKRCNNPNSISYPNYGGRGIKVCDEWLDFKAFKDWAIPSGYDENAPKRECTIERTDVNGNYCPENCTWCSWEQQLYNRRNTIMIEFNGQKKNLRDWSEQTGIKYATLLSRYHKGWPPELIFKPVEIKQPKH